MRLNTVSFLKIAMFLLAVFLTARTPAYGEGFCKEFPVSLTDPGRCMTQSWTAWVVAGKNDATDPNSGVWESTISFTQLDDGLPSGATSSSCGFELFDKNGFAVKQSIFIPAINITLVERGMNGSVIPGQTKVFKISAADPDAAYVAGPASIGCSSEMPEVLRNKIIVTRTFSLVSPDEKKKKLMEISERLPLSNSWKWTVPLNEGSDGVANWNRMGFAVTNVATRQQTGGQPVTVRISTMDALGNKGPSAEITLNPPENDNPGPGTYNWGPGETKVFMLADLFKDPTSGKTMLFQARDGDRYNGSLDIETVGHTQIAVTATRIIEPSGIMTAVPAAPVPMQ